MIAWRAEGALLPPAEHPEKSSFFFSLKYYDTGEVTVDIVAVDQNIDSLFEEYFIGSDSKNVSNVLSHLHPRAASVTSGQSARLRKLAEELQRLRILNGPEAAVAIHPTAVVLSFRAGANKSIQINDEWKQSELREWVERLRAATEPFLPPRRGE